MHRSCTRSSTLVLCEGGSKRSRWQAGQLSVCPRCMKTSPGSHCSKATGESTYSTCLPIHSFSWGARGGFQTQFCVTKTIRVYWQESGQPVPCQQNEMPEVCGGAAEPSRCPSVYLGGRGGPFSAGTQEDISTLTPMAQLGTDGTMTGRLHTLSSPFQPVALDIAGLLQSRGCVKRQQLLTGEACGCSFCHFIRLTC